MKILEKIYIVLRNILVGGILIIGAWSLFYILKTETVEPVVPTAESFNIVVTSENIKQVEGKFRYFFNIKNEDVNDFAGNINIDLINAEGSSVYDKNFNDAQITAGINKSIYIDANTGPTSTHGEFGVNTFSFTVEKNNRVVSSGSGSITTTR